MAIIESARLSYEIGGDNVRLTFETTIRWAAGELASRPTLGIFAQLLDSDEVDHPIRDEHGREFIFLLESVTPDPSNPVFFSRREILMHRRYLDVDRGIIRRRDTDEVLALITIRGNMASALTNKIIDRF